MKKLLLPLLALFIAGSLTGCGDVVPPAHKAKLLCPSGYSPEVLNPGRHWPCFRGRFVLIETGTSVVNEDSMQVLLADKLALTFDLRLRGNIGGSDQIINSMFNEITLAPDEDTLTFNKVYDIYLKPVVRNVARQVVGQYSAKDVHANYTRISHELPEAIKKATVGLPVVVQDLFIGNVQYPEVVTNAVNAAAERQMAIDKERAQAEIDLTKKENQRRLAEADYQVKMTEAKAIRDYNKTITDSVTPELLEYQRLQSLDAMIDKIGPNDKFWIPYDAIGSIGASLHMFQPAK